MYKLEWSLANSMLSLVTLYCWDILAVWHAIWRAPNQSIFVLVELGRIRCCPLLMIRHSLISVSVITPSLSHFWRWPDKICGIFCRAFTVAMATSGILLACLWPGIDVSCAVAMFILPPTGKTNVIGNWEKLSWSGVQLFGELSRCKMI